MVKIPIYFGEKSNRYPYGYGLCQCGCGNKTREYRAGSYRKFIPFHPEPKYRKNQRNNKSINLKSGVLGEVIEGYELGWGYCQCGCGKTTNIKRGLASKYRQGHASRLPENRLRASNLAIEIHKIYPLLHLERIGRSISGYHKSQKLGSTIKFMSLYEKRAFDILDAMPAVDKYIVQPFAIPYYLNGIRHNYMPDILIYYHDGTKKLIEIKPKSRLSSETVQLKIDAAKEYCLIKGITFEIWTEDNLFKKN